MTRCRLAGLLIAVVVVGGCGGSGGGPADETATPSGAPAPAVTTGSPFDLSVLGAGWDVAVKPFEPAPPRPSDCPGFDRQTADRRRWATTERTYRIDGVLVFAVFGRAPTAASALLDGHTAFTNECHRLVYDDGGIAEVEPASSRVNQTMYPFRHQGFDGHLVMLTISGEWFVEVTIFAEPAPTALVSGVSDTLVMQSR
ncbi:MAG: hypothetical protein ACRD1K_00585 [Acidimicrobiales bacterium]